MPLESGGDVEDPHLERNLRLVHSLGRRLVAAHAEWLDEVEETLAQDA